MKPVKPLGRKAYGSIGHLPNSRKGPGDHSVHEGQARICTVKTRDKHDRIIVQEKLDGSCTAVARVDGKILALGRAGYLAHTSPHLQHRYFADWVAERERLFRHILRDGERLVGEWLAQAHGTIYTFDIHLTHSPWGIFDLMRGAERATYQELRERTEGLPHPALLHHGSLPVTVGVAMKRHESRRWPCEDTEGVVYRVERKGKVDFLAKWVKPTKVDGKYLPEVSGQPAVWNWKPTHAVSDATGREADEEC